MNEFKYTSRPFVNRVNLETLGKSFDTLEQGHKEAVKTASDLSRTIASLNMNEKENDFKANLLNEIQTTIEDNTIYGNSYAALDDIIEKSGDILSNPAVTGRLKAQQAYEEYNRNIDNNRDLTERDKLYFKEHNPYHYEDEITEDGKVLEGKAWQPTISPTKHFDLQEALVRAINIAAKESGGGTQIRYIDANGNPTTDIKQAWNGEVFDEVTTSWNRLSKEKIKQALESVIRGTNGAIESLKQQHDIAVWDTQKQVEKTGQLVKDGEVTDENGELLDLKDWIAKSVGEGIKAASYYNPHTSRRMGSGYSKWIAAMKKQQQGNKDISPYITGTSGKIKMNTTPALAFKSIEEATAFRKEINEIWKSMGNNYKLFKDNESEVNFNTVLGIPDSSKLSKENKAKFAILSDMIEQYNNTINFYARQTKNLDKKDKDAFMNSIAGYDTTKIIGGTTFADEVIKSKNKLISFGAKYIDFEDKKTGKVKEFRIDNFYKNTSIVAKYMNGNYKMTVRDANDNIIRDSDNVNKHLRNVYNSMNTVVYKGAKVVDKMSEISGSQPRTSAVVGYSMGTFGEIELKEELDRGLITNQEYNTRLKRLREQSKNRDISRDYSNTEMYIADNSGVGQRIIESNKRAEWGNKIKAAVNGTGDYKYSKTAVSSGKFVGYKYTLTKKGSDDDITEIYIQAEKNEEDIADNYLNSPQAMALDNAYYTIGSKKGNGKNYSGNSTLIPATLDAQVRSNGNGSATIKFCNMVIPNANVETVSDFELLMNKYRNIKKSMHVKGYSSDEDKAELFNTIQQLDAMFGIGNPKGFFNEIKAKDKDLEEYM